MTDDLLADLVAEAQLLVEAGATDAESVPVAEQHAIHPERFWSRMECQLEPDRVEPGDLLRSVDEAG